MQVSSVINLQKAFKNKTEVGCKANALLSKGGGGECQEKKKKMLS